jgi:hypothetical protein
LSSQARATTIFYTDETSWLAAITNLETFDTTAANVQKANEVSGLPGPNERLDVDLLTFEAVNTGLSFDFTVETERPGSRWTFDDHEGSGNIPIFDNALSPGDIGNEDNDNVEWLFSGLSAFGFDLRGNDNNSDGGEFETFEVFGVGGLSLGALSLIPENANSQFIGVVSSDEINRIFFNEDDGGDDVAIANFQFGQKAVAVPEPSTFAIFMSGLIGLGFINNRRKKAGKVA